MDTFRVPKAFSNEVSEFRLKCILWAFVSFFALLALGYSFHVVDRFHRGNFTQKNSFRFSIFMFIIILVFASYLIVVTRGKNTDRAIIMQRDHPIAAYSMTISLLFLLLGTFYMAVELLGGVGIIYFFAAWIFFFNVILILPF